MLRHVKDDLYQVGESVAGRDGLHEAVRVYVLLNDDCPLIFDAGSHLHSEEIMSSLKELLGDKAPEYIFLTHTELPHTGNLNVILKEWPDIKLVVSSGILPHVELPWWVEKDKIQYAYAGTEGVYGGRHISFLDAILKDQPGTHWMYDAETGTLFTADAFGYIFPASADALFDDELDASISTEYLYDYHASAFRFLPYVNGDKMMDDFHKVFDKRSIAVIAPTHGNAIRGNIRKALNNFEDAVRRICQ